MRPTIFTLLHFIVVIAAGMLCFEYGFQWFGPAGGTIGALVGGVSGHIIGCMGGSAKNRLTQWHYRRRSTATLRANLNEDIIPSTYISCLIISILLERGDSAATFRDYIFRQLHSNDPCERRAGFASLFLCYPAQAAQLKAFNTFAPSDDDLLLLKDIEKS